MDALSDKNKLKLYVPFLLIVFCFFLPSLLWGAGYQEEKLFDGNFYSSDELKQKIENHSNEIQVIDRQIKALENDIDWLVLKINQIQDSGRLADSELKKSIASKEKNSITLQKNKSRLEDMVKYYVAALMSDKEKGRQEIGDGKIPSTIEKKEIPLQKKAKIKMDDISSKAPAPLPQPSKALVEKDPDKDAGISRTQLQIEINQSGLSDWVEIAGTDTCLRLETTLPILFPTGSAKVADEYKSFFKKLADFLKPYDVKILVNGYADTVPIKTKKYPSNFELGATRAANIVHQFVNYGLKSSIFKIESTGKYRFAAKTASKQNSLERRAEVTVIFSG